jgi:hypothetical protein
MAIEGRVDSTGVPAASLSLGCSPTVEAVRHTRARDTAHVHLPFAKCSRRDATQITSQGIRDACLCY